jgi:4-hydroxy-2-oxoglutarate aldolase
VADKVRTPILIYNIPQVTGVSISVDTVARLAKHERIIGIKDSSGNINYMLDLCSALPKDFTILAGNAGSFVPALLAGAKGGILGIANVLPEPAVKMYQLFRDGKSDKAMELQKAFLPAIRLIMGDLGIPGIKLGMNMRGAYGGEPRLPLLPCNDSDRELLNALFKEMVKNKLIPGMKIGA